MASFTKESSTEKPTAIDIINDIHDRTVLQIPATIRKIEQLPERTEDIIQTGSCGASGYRSTDNGKPVVVKQMDVLSKIKNNILDKLSTLPPEKIEKYTKYIVTGLLNEIVNYHEVSQMSEHFFCKFIGYKIEYKPDTTAADSFTFLVYIVMEDCGEKDLHDFSGDLLDDNNFTNTQRLKILCSIFGKLLFDLMLLHDNGFVHLDLKPENIFIKTNPDNVSLDEKYTVLLGDAGSLTKIGDTPYVDGPIGTPIYKAWEVYDTYVTSVKNDDDLKGADIYSIFIIIYKLLEEYKHFGNKNINTHIFNILFGKYIESRFYKSKYFNWLEMVRNSKSADRPDINTLVALFDHNKSIWLGGKRRTYKKPSRKARKKNCAQKTNRRRRR